MMMIGVPTLEQAMQEIDLLRAQLDEARQALDAIRSGEVDALLVSTETGDQIFTLQGAEHPYRVMVETMNEGAATLLEDGTILYANPRLAAMLQVPLEKLIGSSFLDYIPSEDWDSFDCLMNQGFHSSIRAETRLEGKQVHLIPVLVSLSPTQVEGTQALCLVVTDLTEQKRNEEILAAERLARSILSQAAETILVCDQEGKVIRASEVASQTCRQNPIHRPFEEAFPILMTETEGKVPSFSIKEILQGKSFQYLEVQGNPEDGQDRYFLLSAAPLVKEPEEVIGCVITLTDISLHKSMEKALREANRLLQEQAEELEVQAEELRMQTEELLAANELLRKNEETLREYAEKLERSNQDLQDFAFIASHDLQEPLRKIVSFGQILLSSTENLDEQQREFLNRMRSTSERMQRMIDDLLALSRISTRGQPFVTVDLSHIVTEVLSDLDMQIQRTGGKVLVGDLPVVKADPFQIRQLMQNLISNALKYHQEGIPPVVKIYQGSGAGDQGPGTRIKPQLSDHQSLVTIYVEDNGIGFDQNDVARIFQPFQRLVGRSQYEGTGIGLALCKKIVERHGGSITAVGKQGQGATFIVALPLN